MKADKQPNVRLKEEGILKREAVGLCCLLNSEFGVLSRRGSSTRWHRG